MLYDKVDEAGHNNLVRDDRDRIARAVFAVAESMGVSDRNVKERTTQEVIRRLEQQQSSLPLPGMEHLLGSRKPVGKQGISSARMSQIVKEVLVQSRCIEDARENNESRDGDSVYAATTSEKPSKQSVSSDVSTFSATIHEKQDIGRHAAEASEKVLRRMVHNPAVSFKPTAADLSPNALRVLEKRYLRKDEEGNVIETPEQMFRRVAHCVASAEIAYDPQTDVRPLEEQFFQTMTNLEFLPNSPTLMNAGRELGQLSACFVLPIEDSMESIFDTVKQTALIHKSGGGTGFSFSSLRPESDRVGSTGGIASGPVSFMRVFDIVTDVIKQGGTRRGANMAILKIDHPDILRFISAKEKGTVFSNFNLSVAITEDFMKAVEEDHDYDLVNPRTGQVAERLSAKKVFDKIVDMAWRTGDPGIIFIDRIRRDNPTPNLGEIESTNPCGEQPLLPYESCNLGSINLARMVRHRDGMVEVDYEKLRTIVKKSVRFLDNVIDVNRFPSPEIERMTRATRKIGLGVMGFADMLIRLGLPYDSEEALTIAGEVMHYIQRQAADASRELARKRGTFPAFEGSIYSDGEGQFEMRNATRTTIAPTGTLSIIAGCSSGIEPLFAVSYIRTILEGEQLLEVNPYFEEIARKEGFYSEELMKELARRGSVRGIEKVPQWVQQLFATAHDITPEWHVRMQAAFQEQTNNAVSKTVNFPHNATREDVTKVYHLAYKLGCKGITIYRDRSKDCQVLSISHESGSAVDEKKSVSVDRVPRKRPRNTVGRTEMVSTGCGHLYVTVNRDDQGICEVFSALGKAGGCASAQLECISRLISLSLRSGVDLSDVVKHLKGLRCPSIAWEEGHAVLSCPDAIASVLEKELEDASERPKDVDATPVKNVAGQCPDCGNLLVYQEGCFSCRLCGYTKCG